MEWLLKRIRERGNRQRVNVSKGRGCEVVDVETLTAGMVSQQVTANNGTSGKGV